MRHIQGRSARFGALRSSPIPVIPRALTGVVAAVITLAMTACNGIGGGSEGNDTKGLWIANRTSVVEYTPSQLNGTSLLGGSTSSASMPHLTLASASFGAPQGVSFDSSGNLWVVDPIAVVNGGSAPALLEFSAAQLAALSSNPAPEPVTVITSASMAFPQQSAFDAAGDLWVTEHDNNTVLEFSAAQLGTAGANELTPAAIITSTALTGPIGIAFDSGGNLYVANNGQVTTASGAASAAGTTVVAFSAASLPSASGSGQAVTLTPSVTVSADSSGSIQGPWGLAFDSDGNLLVSNATASTVIEIPAASLASSSAPTPSLTLTSANVGGNPSIATPNGVCLDNAGDLAVVSNGGVFGLAFYGSPVPNGAATPANFLAPGVSSTGAGTTGLETPAGCAFGPDIE